MWTIIDPFKYLKGECICKNSYKINTITECRVKFEETKLRMHWITKTKTVKNCGKHHLLSSIFWAACVLAHKKDKKRFIKKKIKVLKYKVRQRFGEIIKYQDLKADKC